MKKISYNFEIKINKPKNKNSIKIKDYKTIRVSLFIEWLKIEEQYDILFIYNTLLYKINFDIFYRYGQTYGDIMRLDQYMVQLGLTESRQKAQRLIRAGVVLCNGKIMQKPSQTITDSDQVTVVNDVLPYVGRGGLKLERALQLFGVDPTGLVCADIGASTGGFTDCLLQHGAARVYAVDSGREQLHLKLRTDTRVVCMEQCNARYLDVSQLGERVPLVVCDVSFFRRPSYLIRLHVFFLMMVR